jgi:hypothetical protein
MTIDIKITVARDFKNRSSNTGTNCPKMGQSQRGVEAGSFEGGGVGSFKETYCPKLYRACTSSADKARS